MGDSEKVLQAIVAPGLTLVDEAFFAPARRQQRVAKREAAVQREAQAVSQAQQENERQASIRSKLRKERVRRAQIISEAASAGVGGSSAETSAIGVGQTLTSAGSAFATGATLSNQYMGQLMQQQADLNYESQKIQYRGQMAKSVFDLGMKVATVGAGG